jgi:hypothetical protein
MPIRYHVDRLHGRLLTHADGVVTFHDINAHLDLEQRDHNLDRPELIDARGATTNLTRAQIRRLVQRAANMLRVVDLGPTAIVTNDDVVFGWPGCIRCWPTARASPPRSFVIWIRRLDGSTG